MGATAGRSTLAGEGLQHQDGNSHLLALTVPNLEAYDPAYAYELAVLIQDGIRRMYEKGEDIFYYITLMNENYAHPAMPEGVRDGILKGLYPVQACEDAQVNLLGSGAILPRAIEAAGILRDKFGVQAAVWSATSYKALYRDACSVDRWNRNHPSEAPRLPYVAECLSDAAIPAVSASDYVRAVPECIAQWVPGSLVTLGTDGFGRSDGREALRDFFEIDAEHIAYAAVCALTRKGTLSTDMGVKAAEELKIDLTSEDPAGR